MSGFLSLFSLGWYWYEDGVFREWIGGQILDEAPLVALDVQRYRRRYFFDRHGNELSDDAPFIYGDAVATGFYLHDFGNDGIPEIVIIAQIPESCGIFTSIYRFIDGEYRNVHMGAHYSRFYTDAQRRFTMFNLHGASPGVDVHYFTFTQEGMEAEFLFGGDNEDDEFIERLNELSLTPIEPLHELQAEITASINQRLGLTGVIAPGS